MNVFGPCAGVKSYPRGVTTNSESGIESYTVYYPVFKAMEERGMILNIHGEVPSDHSKVRRRLVTVSTLGESTSFFFCP